jgi:hypothetical protein
LAKDERENVRIGLDSSGNAFSWIQICPRFKIDKEGDRILSNAEVLLKVAERSNEYVHSADRDPPPGMFREINCSLETTSWKLGIYQSSTDTFNKSHLLASQLLYINDPETKSYLSIAQPPPESFDDEDDPTTEETASSRPRSSYAHEHGDLVLAPPTQNHLDSNFLWMLETSNFFVGGPIKWKTDQVRLKHFNTGLYLRQETQVVFGENGSSLKKIVFTKTEDRDVPGTLFNLVEVNSQAKYLGNGKAVQIGINGLWIDRGDVMDGSAATFMVCGGRDQGSALSLMINRYSKNMNQSAKDDVDPGDMIDPSLRMPEPLDMFVGLSGRFYLEKYFRMVVIPDDGEAVNTIWPSGNRTDVEVFKGIIDKMVIFAQGFPVSTVHVQAGVDKADAKIRLTRQNLIKEQGILELLLRFIHKIIPVFDMMESNSKLNLDNSLLVRMAHSIQGLCFSLMYHTIHDNSENQMFVADYMPILLANLNSQPLAVRCVTNMLSKNMELQETKIGTREIQIFVDKLKASKLNPMYLELLQACCSCEGSGVDGNQCKVANMLFSGSNEVILAIAADYAFTHQVDWKQQNSLFLNIPSDADGSLRGSILMKMGLPKLTVTWVTEDGSNPRLGSIEELFDPVLFAKSENVGESASPSTKSATHDQRLKVANYLLSEMFLGAEMCMDRNYVAMHKLDDLFPYEVLVTILKLNVSSNVKAAAVRLMMCLHVDRDPQATSKIPCLTRTWSDIKKNTEPQLPYVEPNRRYMFGLIQQMVSDHIKEMAGNRWDELSRHVLRMLHALVQFNFYGTNDRMQDVIGPLIAALDRRTLQITDLNSIDNRPRSVSSKVLVNPDAMRLPTGIPSLGDDDSLAKDDATGGNDEETTVSSLAKRKSERLSRKKNFEKFYQRLDSTSGNITIISMICLALGLDVYQIVSGGSFQNFEANILGLIELAFLAFFIIEISIRAHCAFRIDEFKFYIMDVVNILDLISIIANVIIFFVTIHIDNGLAFIKALRLIRIIRFLKVSQDAKVVLSESGEKGSDLTISNVRYLRAPMLELETMVEAVDILQFMQHLIEDRNLSLLLRNFYLWETGADKRDPAQLFQSSIEASQVLTLNVQDFESVMLDCLMFAHSPLVQSVLEVLMSHYSMKSNLLTNARNAQILASSKREKQFRSVDQMLQQLEQNAETHELWGELETEGDKITNKQTKQILIELTELCRVRRFVLEFDEDYMADTEIQDLYRNLGCFEICMKVLGLLDSVEEDEDGNLGEVGLNTKELCWLCNNLLYWFFLGNAKNQELGYSELEFFLETLDDDISSHMVVRAVFSENESLMRQVPHSHLSDLVDKIIKNGKSHHYLSLFAAISHVGDKNIVENQFEIVKSLTSPGRLQKVACFFVPIDHPEYAEKRELMASFLETTKDLSLDDLPPLLAYHLMFLEVLSGCTVGRMNITTVEAKVQSVFNYVDILQSILDPGTITVCKIRLSKFFYNSIIEVELKIPGLEQSAYIWKLLETYISILGYAKDELRTVEKLGWESPEVSRQKIEYIMVCILITGGFFSRYYDKNAFRFHEGGPVAANDKVHISQTQANELIISLFTKIKDVYDLDSPRLSSEMKESIFAALESLNKSANKVIINNLQPNASLSQGVMLKQNITAEGKLLEKYNKFIDDMCNNADVNRQVEQENFAFIDILEQLPRISDPVEADIRYETLIRKLISHIRDNITVTETRKYMDVRVTKTSTWIIKAFRNMIENRMGMSIYERDDEGGQEQDIAAAPVVNALNSCGATALCLDLIADGIDEKLQLEAIRLGVGLLFKEGGALEVQQLMNDHLNKTNSELFFKQVRLTLQKLQAWHTWHQVIILEEGQDPKPPDEILIVRFLQLMCEGHFLPNQDILREQPNNRTTYNLLDDFVNYLNCLSRIPCRTSTTAAIRTAATILEVIQGPCDGNQAHFALNTELIETLNRINRAKMVNDCVEDEEIELKKTSIDIFQGLLEGQGEKSQVYERVLSVVHLDIIQMMSKGIGITGDVVEELNNEGNDSEEKIILQTECVVLLQMLCNFKPSLYEELGISQNIEDIVGSGTAMIEVIWRGDIHRRFFHVPNICSFLAKSSKDALVENVNRTNSENKLIDFLHRSHDLYREVKHQQLLTEMGLSRVFSRENQNRATWITFYLALLINILFVAFYDASSGTPAVNNRIAQGVINALNVIQSVVAVFVLLLSLVVRSPVIYQSFEAAGHSPLYTILYTATDAKTMYYFLYLLLSLLGLFIADYFLPFLLLDIVAKNATTRDILNAVVIPRKQLIMTVVLAVFVTYIYSYFLVRKNFFLICSISNADYFFICLVLELPR